VRAALALVAVLAGQARADDSSDKPDVSYLYDGGAIPLLWLPLAAGYVIDSRVQPRSTPLLFDRHEGGAQPASWQVPPLALTFTGLGVAGLFALASDDPSRWYHAKGLVEALATSSLVVSIAKPVFGRHRPDWTASTTDLTESESFPSGHATNAFAIATYSALYLHGHVWRDEPFSLSHGLAYAGIFAGAALVDVERVYHDRHFTSDVIAGSILGSVTSLLIYRYQDARASGHRTHDWVIAPSIDGRASTLSLGGTF
jgi:membrane-associated phospholipid phosphatase